MLRHVGHKYRGRDSNSHARRHWFLRPAWLPLHHLGMVGPAGLEPATSRLSKRLTRAHRKSNPTGLSGRQDAPLSRMLNRLATPRCLRGAPGRTRTGNLCLRRATLCPLSYGRVERTAGVEPAYQGWKPCAQPISQARISNFANPRRRERIWCTSLPRATVPDVDVVSACCLEVRQFLF